MKISKPMRIADIPRGDGGAPATGGEGGGAPKPPAGEDRKTDLDLLEDIDDVVDDDVVDEGDGKPPKKKETPPVPKKKEGEDDDEEEDDDEDDEDDEEEDDDDLTDEEKEAKRLAKAKKKEDDDEEIDEDAEILNRPSPRAIKEKYPNFFKDFPEFRHVIFREQAFSETFTSVEEAREAVARISDFTAVEEHVSQGHSSGILKMLSKNSPEALEPFVTNFLPTVWNGDKELYAKAVNPILINFIRQVAKHGDDTGGETGKSFILAAKYFSKYLTNKAEIPSLPTTPQNDPAMDRVRERENAIAQREYSAFEGRVVGRGDKALYREIRRGIDPDNALPEYVRSALEEKVFKDVQSALKKDTAYLNRMSLLWKRAGQGGYGSDHESQIVTAFLGRARQILPAIRQKARQQALTRSTANGAGQEGNEPRKKKQVPPGGQNRQTESGGTGKHIDPKRINYQKTSDMDLLDGKAVLKR